MANPFLMGDLDTQVQPQPPSAAGFNPFLSGADFSAPTTAPTNTDNPFMSSIGDSFLPSSDNTNPFAFGGESDTSTDFFTSTVRQTSSDVSRPTAIDFSDIFASSAPVSSTVTATTTATDIFSSHHPPPKPPPPKPAPPKPAPPAQLISEFTRPPPPQQKTSQVPDFFDSFAEPTTKDRPLLPDRPDKEQTDGVHVMGGIDSLLGTTDEIGSSVIVNLLDDIPAQDVDKSDSDTGAGSGTGPPIRRPPPPRPAIPPSKETKELILSVTGAMEATSSDLLDRLQATRTPSPTPIRELHSPSPTPDMQVSDLLGVDVETDLLGDEVIQQTPAAMSTHQITGSVLSLTSSPEPETILEATPTSATVAPVENTAPAAAPLTTTSGPPPRPLPPAVPERPKLPPTKPPVPRPPAVAVEPVTTDGQEPMEKLLETEPEPKTVEQQPQNIATDIFGVNTENQDNNNIDFFNIDQTTTTTTAFQDDLLFIKETTNIESASQPQQQQQTPFISDDIFGVPTTEQKSNIMEESNDFFSTTVTTSEDQIGSISTTTVEQQPFSNIFDPVTLPPAEQKPSIPTATTAAAPVLEDAFDAFAAKFESADKSNLQQPNDPFDPFSGGSSAFGDISGQTKSEGENVVGFGAEDNFDAFLALREEEPPPVPQSTPARVSRADSRDSDDGDNDFNIFIKPKTANAADITPGAVTPVLAPPPKSPVQDSSPRFNPFDKTQDLSGAAPDNFFASADLTTIINDAITQEDLEQSRPLERTESQETPPTPLFDEDVSQPLEDFPRIHYTGSGWEMQLRQPNKKKITGQRFWKKVFIKLVYQGENPVLQLFNNKDDKDPFQELPLQPCYSVSEIGAQQYDQFGKIFTVKLQFIFYKERPGVRPGQVTKAERLTNKLSQFAAYAIQGDYQGVKEFGSDLKKLGLPVEHAPQISQLFKIGSQSYEDMKQLSVTIEEALFRLPAHRDRALNYKMEEVQITAVDELYVEQNKNGGITRQIARVRLFFLGFLSGMPDIELGVNDMVRQGKEVVGRHDIIPVVTEEWIRLENVEFHSCVQQDEYERTRTIKFKPPDACYIELMRFRVRPPKNRELPLQLKTTMCITGNKVELKADILVPGFSSRKLGQIPCEDVMVRFPIPECWIYLFRVEKHFRYGSVKSAHRRSGKIKGIERFLGAVDNLEPSLMEVTSGQAKYEHQHRAIVWRMPRLPKEGQGAYTTHNLVCRMALTSYDQIPDELAQYCYVEFTMPVTQVSHTTVRSVSIADSDSDTPPEKYVRQLARHEYVVEIEHTQAEAPSDYIAATAVSKPTPAPITEEPPATPAAAAADSDSDSSS
ncbi:stoned B [Lycorma delicatula]|uniref:stoned B n=1 Tax=Lycorma delicatula TaxID=130591 RepID=UPI003F50FCC6